MYYIYAYLESTLCDGGHSFLKEFRKNVKDYLTDIEKNLLQHIAKMRR